MFNWFSLDIIYYPVSAIMWVWYKLFGFLLGPDNFFAWALTVMFLVFTLRAILYKPFVRQIRTCLLYTSPSPRDGLLSRMPSSA